MKAGGTTRTLITVVALVAGSAGLTACGTGSAASDSTTQGGNMTQVDNATIIDVRTPEEFAEGHVQGAVNLNVEDGTLESRLATLDPNGSYRVYCRSGRRSAIAAQLMASKGFAQVTDLGALEAAADALNLPIVTG